MKTQMKHFLLKQTSKTKQMKQIKKQIQQYKHKYKNTQNNKTHNINTIFKTKQYNI